MSWWSFRIRTIIKEQVQGLIPLCSPTAVISSQCESCSGSLCVDRAVRVVNQSFQSISASKINTFLDLAAFEVVATVFSCGGSNHFYRLSVSVPYKSAQRKQSASVSNTLISPFWLICAQVRSQTQHTSSVLYCWLSQLTGVKHDVNFPLHWWKLHFWRISVPPKWPLFQT